MPPRPRGMMPPDKQSSLALTGQHSSGLLPPAPTHLSSGAWGRGLTCTGIIGRDLSQAMQSPAWLGQTDLLTPKLSEPYLLLPVLENCDHSALPLCLPLSLGYCEHWSAGIPSLDVSKAPSVTSESMAPVVSVTALWQAQVLGGLFPSQVERGNIWRADTWSVDGVPYSCSLET